MEKYSIELQYTVTVVLTCSNFNSFVLVYFLLLNSIVLQMFIVVYVLQKYEQNIYIGHGKNLKTCLDWGFKKEINKNIYFFQDDEVIKIYNFMIPVYAYLKQIYF